MNLKHATAVEGVPLEVLRGSRFYKEHVARVEEVLKHKWIESEKEGRDIGFDRALVDWLVKHGAAWASSRVKARSESGLSQIDP